MKAFYFGCIGGTGHYMHRTNLTTDYDWCRNNPWGYSIDGSLCPVGPEVEGRALVHHKDGWTAVAFWDRSVDRRGQSNSAFIAEGHFDFAQMLSIATLGFPSVLARFKFPIMDATPSPVTPASIHGSKA